MHAVFIPYGHKRWVGNFLRDIEAQKYLMPFTSPDGKETKMVPIEGQLRILPFGVYEHIFPREYRDQVLTTLDFNPKGSDHYVNNAQKAILRKMLKIQKAPKDFKMDKAFFWIKNFVSISPLGIKEDTDIIDTKPEWLGWKHEGI